MFLREHFCNLFLFRNLYPFSKVQWVNLLFPARTDMPPSPAGKNNKIKEVKAARGNLMHLTVCRRPSLSAPIRGIPLILIVSATQWDGTVEKWQIHVSKRQDVRLWERKRVSVSSKGWIFFLSSKADCGQNWKVQSFNCGRWLFNPLTPLTKSELLTKRGERESQYKFEIFLSMLNVPKHLQT